MIETPEQQRIIDTWGQGLAVLAGAGSGKTTTLVKKCARLLELNPKAHFAAVSFTEKSASDLRAKLSQKLVPLLGPSALHSHWIMTIHGLCGSIIHEFPKEAGMAGGEGVLSESDSILFWERAIESVWIEDLPDPVRVSFEMLLDRESRDGLSQLLKRVRELSSFGIIQKLATSEDPESRALAQVAQFVIEKYQRLKQRQGSIDFNDLELGADRALQFENVREAYQSRFDLVLVDEFQDTNPLQASIISRMVKPDLSNLCVVGDPKQSIYRFRDADVTVFEEFCSRMPLQQSLTWNFRSRPGIIDFANQICHHAFQKSEMKFESLIPRREALPDTSSVIRLDLTNPVELGHWILGEVSRGIPLHEMALLVRKVRGNEKWFKALSACGIPIAVGSGGLFWEDPRVRELVSFLKWWDNPGHKLSGAVFLRAPWVGIPDQDLDQWVRQDPTWRKPFFESDHPIALELKPWIDRSVRPGELLMTLLVDQEREDELAAPLLGLWHRVEELSSRGLDFHAVVVEMTKAMEESRREKEVPAPKNLGQLSVLTFHGSKGLEFPHVILIDFGAKPHHPDMPLLFWDRENGAFLGKRDSDGNRDRNHPLEVPWRQNEKNKSLAESKRLFYVALTRAQERLVLVCPDIGGLEEKFDREKVFETDHWRGWIECCGIDISRENTSVRAERMSRQENLQRPLQLPASQKGAESFRSGWTRARHSVTEWTQLSRCARAYEWSFIRPVAVAEGVPDLGTFTGEKVTTWLETEISRQELGTRVHSCLERGDYEGLKSLEAEVGRVRFIAEPVISWAMSCSWMAPSQPTQNRKVWTELSFEVPIEGEVIVGSIDRLVLDESEDQPVYYLIDFKVSEKPKSVTALTETYQNQIELYAWALTVLDPKIQFEQIRPVIVNISSGSVQVVPFSVGNLNIQRLLSHSIKIIDGEPGAPKPGYYCRFCEFKSQCPEAAVPSS
jgi:ATP-dependent exoDNAse (exonuclease V) beta subunit